MNLEDRINNAKSKLVQQAAEKLGIQHIEIKMVELSPEDMCGKPDLSIRGSINEAIDNVVEERISRDIKVGDVVLMEYAKGITETVKIDVVHDGIAYGLGVNDGESYCAPFANCDKVPV